MSKQLELTQLKRQWIDESIPLASDAVRFLGTFEAYDLSPFLPKPPVPGYMGCLVAKLKRMGRIREVGFNVSRNPSNRGSRVLQWQKA